VRKPLARFAVVGSVVTAVDVGVLAALASRNLVLADIVAVGAATVASFELHQQVTFRGEPYRRWLSRREAFIA
jgi:putative flippase GtrA